ncbi:MAG: hypothetical protein EOO38_01810 [Cytophagaceae bacterium]|nr:MAG: hypothetical protein EOO38_01810 [Cytophagaceae bacterium]
MVIDYSSGTLAGAIDGHNAIFRLSQLPNRLTVMVFINGLFRDPGLDNGWFFDGPLLVNLAEPPLPGDTVAISYDKAVPTVPIVVPQPPKPTEPDGLPPLLTPAQYGLAQGNIPDGGNATVLTPTISGAMTFTLLLDPGQTSNADVLAPTIIGANVI